LDFYKFQSYEALRVMIKKWDYKIVI
jgi:hypothetical protein